MAANFTHSARVMNAISVDQTELSLEDIDGRSKPLKALLRASLSRLKITLELPKSIFGNWAAVSGPARYPS